ncbi:MULTISPECIES: hypothetical protein [unclassified Corallococcus]|uniref:hypothetical protein n=1 Tax=unclassified Corallococcus TaxID=2685029 RepID=UPI001A8EF1F4|nr:MULTISPECIES: hypothetical protein [unclassified Corallococcus]MBN9682314.1 hypothetical protein [Corallococcus sp. NCSPR001]WAS86130.1 hypothetical protein O0N60_03960 [Corallococcus sp. NCRR]
MTASAEAQDTPVPAPAPRTAAPSPGTQAPTQAPAAEAPKPTAPAASPWSLTQGGPQDDTGAGLAVGKGGDVLWVTSGTPRSDEDREQVDGERLVLTLSRYSADGTKQWAKEFERNRLSDLRVAGSTGNDGAVFLSGNAFLYSADFGLGEAQDGFLVKFTQAGEPEWQRRVGQKVYAVAADAAGGVVALGEEWTPEAHTPQLVRYAADGTVAWTKTFNGAKEGTLLSAVALSGTGTPVVAGRLVGPVTVDGRTFDAQGTGGFVVLAFGADGALAWGREVPGVNGRVGSVSVGADGTVAVAGEAVGLLVWNGVALDEGGPFVLTAAADGQERWVKQPTCGATSVGTVAAVEPSGPVATACGDTVTRYAADGALLGTKSLAPESCESGTCSLATTTLVAAPESGLVVSGWQRDGAGNTWNQDAFLRLVTP